MHTLLQRCIAALAICVCGSFAADVNATTTTSHAVIKEGKNVVVMPLIFSYTIKTTQSDGEYTLVQKSLNSEEFTGMIESALAEAGITVASRDKNADSPESSDTQQQAQTPTSDINATDSDSNTTSYATLAYKPGEAESIQVKQAVAAKSADYILTGQLISARIDGIRRVPDGTNTRYAVGATVRMTIKITDSDTQTAVFVKLITGNAKKSFESSDSVPYAQALDEAVDDAAAQISAALSGKRNVSPSESDSEYQDSPGKRLIE